MTVFVSGVWWLWTERYNGCFWLKISLIWRSVSLGVLSIMLSLAQQQLDNLNQPVAKSSTFSGRIGSRLKTRFPINVFPWCTSVLLKWIHTFLCSLSTVLTSVSEREFIEGRRRALGRFLNLVARHPFFSEDELVKTFLTFSGSVRSIFGTCRLTLWPALLHNKHYRHDDWQCNASCSSKCLFPLTHDSPLFPNRMFRLSCVTLTRKWAMSSWPTELQPLQRFVTHIEWKNPPNNHRLTSAFKMSIMLCCICFVGISPCWHSGPVLNKQGAD